MDLNTLHLWRKPGEVIVIGEPPHQVFVIMGENTDNGTRLIFKAPRSIQINRLEISEDKYRQG